jgi:hypothetical protein
MKVKLFLVSILFICLITFVCGCSSSTNTPINSPTITSVSKSDPIIGTWEVNNMNVGNDMRFKFNSDGTYSYIWDIPAGRFRSDYGTWEKFNSSDNRTYYKINDNQTVYVVKYVSNDYKLVYGLYKFDKA